jgi:hypothetical protein
MLIKMILILLASLFVTFKAVCSEGESQQAWFFAGFVLMILFGVL